MSARPHDRHEPLDPRKPDIAIINNFDIKEMIETGLRWTAATVRVLQCPVLGIQGGRRAREREVQMARYLADYIVVRDRPIHLSSDGQEAWNTSVEFPAGTVFSEPMIIQWWYLTQSGADDLEYAWSMEGVQLRRSRISGNRFGTYHEVFSNVPFADEFNLRAEIVGGSGRLDLSDVVIWFQREVE